MLRHSVAFLGCVCVCVVLGACLRRWGRVATYVCGGGGVWWWEGGVSAVYGQKSWRNTEGVFLEDWRASTASPSTFPSPPVYCRPHTLQYRLGKEAWKRGYLATKKGQN